MRLLLPLLLLGALGCSAELVQLRKRKTGPVPEIVLDKGGGQARYSLRGLGFVVNARRRDAFEKIAETCGGPDAYRIADEVARQDAQATFTGGDLAEEENLGKNSRHYDFVDTQYLYFECTK